MTTRARTILMTGGAWWSEASTSNLGHQFLLHTVRSATSPVNPRPSTPLKVYLCARKPPPLKELELFVLRNATRTDAGTENEINGVDDRVLDHIKLFHIPLDLSSPSSVIKCATEFLRREEKLDLVLLNAAIAPKERRLTSSEIGGEKVEEALMTNVLGNALLLDCLRKAFKTREEGEQTRIVTVSSELHRRLAFPVTPDTLPELLSSAKWNGMQTYKMTKLLQTQSAFTLPSAFSQPVTSVSVSPGFVPSTSLSRNSPRIAQWFMSYLLHYAPFASTPEEGGKKIFEACFGEKEEWGDDGIKGEKAVYLKDYKSVPAADAVYDLGLRQAWKSWIDAAVQGLKREHSL